MLVIAESSVRAVRLDTMLRCAPPRVERGVLVLGLVLVLTLTLKLRLTTLLLPHLCGHIRATRSCCRQRKLLSVTQMTVCVRIVLDTGSQRSYTTDKKRRELCLKTAGTQDMTIMTFGSDRG